MNTNYSIKVDFDVWREIVGMRGNEEMTENDVLRGILNLPDITTEEKKPPNNIQQSESFLSSGGYSGIPQRMPYQYLNGFPDGTRLRARHRYREYTAVINKGKIELNGKQFFNFSPAAFEITNTATNGWKFWEVQLPGENNWTMASSMRHQHPQRQRKAK